MVNAPLPFEIQAFWAGLAAVAAGAINALAGGGSLLSFPALTAIGLPAVMANVTNTVALVPGYLGATRAQRRELQGQRQRLLLLLPAAALGGLLGGWLLLKTGERLFTQLVPFLILFASALLAVQEPVRRWLQRRSERHGRKPSERWAVGPVFLAAVYGGFFGGGAAPQRRCGLRRDGAPSAAAAAGGGRAAGHTAARRCGPLDRGAGKGPGAGRPVAGFLMARTAVLE